MDPQTLNGDIALVRSFVDVVPIPCAVTALADGEILACNAFMQELVGMPDPAAQEPGARPCTTARYYADPTQRARLVRDLETSAVLQDYEIEAVSPEGRHVSCLASFQRLTWEGRAVLLSCFVDIADRKAAEAALRTSEERFRELAENTSDVIWHLDLSLTVTYFNGGVGLMNWLGQDAVLGRNALEFFAPESADRLRAEWKQRLSREAAGQRSQKAQYEVELRNKEGSSLWVELQVYPHHDANGVLKDYFGIMRDISERKRAEMALHQSEQLFRQMFDADPVAKLLIDPDSGVIVKSNARATALYGGAETGLTGRAITAVVEPLNPDDLTLLSNLRDAATHGGGPVEVIHRLASGERRHVAAHVGIVDVPGTVGADQRHLNLSLFDVTDRHNYAVELRQHNAALRDFTTAVSHDLQEPLRLITSYLGLLERRLGDRLEGDERDFIAYAVDGAARMRSMILGLLSYARLDTRARQAEAVALEEVVEAVKTALRATIAEVGAAIEIPAPLPSVQADRQQAMSLFQNLISNAIRYRRRDQPCRISILCHVDGPFAVIGIRDNGIGIAPVNHDRVFGVFQRLREVCDEEEPGTGMGLAICRRIVTRHGGHMWVESIHGEGATFWLTLPLAQTSSVADPEAVD